MNNTNSLVSGDNKGAAAQFMERWAASQPAQATAADLVAAFCQANVGDTSPNTLGAFCMDTGLPCDAVHSTCNGRVQQCIGRGPGWPDHFLSTQIIGQKQADTAQQLFTGATERVRGPVEYRHAFLDMRGLVVKKSNFTRAGATCKPAMGFAFAAGTTDGEGVWGPRLASCRPASLLLSLGGSWDVGVDWGLEPGAWRRCREAHLTTHSCLQPRLPPPPPAHQLMPAPPPASPHNLGCRPRRL